MPEPFGVGAVVQTLRRARLWSQADLASAAGVGINVISRVERGASNYRRSTIEQIARALDTSVAALTGSGASHAPDDDPATRKLLAMWHELSAAHRPAALDALAHVVALQATVSRLEARLADLEREASRLVVPAGRSAAPGRVRSAAAPDSDVQDVQRRGRRRP